MAIFGSVFALVGRFAGRLLNSALGWATLLLFGKVEGRKQTLLLVIALGSLLWVLVLVGVVFPDVGSVMLAFVPVPDFIDDGLVRLIMLVIAVAIPILIGIAAIFIADPSTRPKGAGIAGGVLRGYPFTALLAVTILILAGVSLVRKVRSLFKRWEDAHVPVVVKPGGYDRVLGDLERVLDSAGLDVTPKPAPAVLSIPPRMLDAVAGKALGGLVPDRLMVLSGADVEVLVYPSDVAISGTKRATARSRAAIADQLTESPAYMTTSAESEKIEDEIRQLANADAADVETLRRKLADLDVRIAELEVPFDEWETVYRERLQVERDRLRAAAVAASGRVASPLRSAPSRERPSALGTVVASLGFALIGLDVLLLALERVGRLRRR